MHKHVVGEVVAHDLCIGCGVCAGVCPSKVLKMEWRENGDLTSSHSGTCPSNCGLCLRVCPSSLEAMGKDKLADTLFADIEGIQYDCYAGYHLASFLGYSRIDDQRKHGASGGVVTWLLESLLTGGMVDGVVCVGSGGEEGRLFSFQVIQDVPSIRRAAGSRYYPVDLAQVVSTINARENEMRYAVVGLPCMINALRLAMDVMPRLRRRIVYTIGLVCGHLPNRYYTEYLSRMSGINPNNLAYASYRLKEGTTRAGDYKFLAVADDGSSGRGVRFSQGINRIWHDGYFRYNVCNYCDDVFAEVADAVVMDAWLPEYERDPRGHSLLILRHPKLLQLVTEGQARGTCYMQPLPISKLVESQKGNVYKKRVLSKGYLYRAIEKGSVIPQSRLKPCKAVYLRNRRFIEAQLAIQESSKLLWPDVRREPLERFQRHFLLFSMPLKQKRLIDRVKRVLRNPSLLLKILPGRINRRLTQGRTATKNNEAEGEIESK